MRAKYKWYDKWHKHKKHGLFHWLGLIAFSELAFLFVLMIAAVVLGEAGSSSTGATLCVRQAPEVTINAPVTSAAPGTTLNYHLTLRNKDSHCPRTLLKTTIKVDDAQGWLIGGWPFNPVDFSVVLRADETHDKDIPIRSSNTATAGPHKITIIVENAAKKGKGNYATQATADYTVTTNVPEPPPIAPPEAEGCFRAPPELAIGNPTTAQPAIPGQKATYSLTLSNKDTLPCAPTSFNFTANPTVAGIRVNAPDPVSVGTARENYQKRVDFTVDTSKTIQPGDYGFILSAARSSATFPGPGANTETILHRVASSVGENPNCVRNDPEVTVTDRRKSAPAGGDVLYEVIVKNTDQSCSGSNFLIEGGPLPFGWRTRPNTVALESGRQASVNFAVISAADALPRDYTFSISATNQNSTRRGFDNTLAVFAVQAPEGAPPPEPQISIIDPSTSPALVNGDFSVTAQVTGVYRVDRIVFRIDNLSETDAMSCAFTGVSVCTKLIHTSGWASGSSHTIMAIAKKNGSRVGQPATVTAILSNIQLPTPPTATLTASPNTVVAGNASSTTLAWTVSNSLSCQGSGGAGNWPGPKNPSGGSQIISPVAVTASTLTFTLTCIGVDGSVSANAQVVVTAAPAGGDTAAPALAIFQPSDGQSFESSQPVAIEAVANDDTAVTEIKLFINGVEKKSCPGANVISCGLTGWASALFVSGNNTIKASAFDAAGHRTNRSIGVFRYTDSGEGDTPPGPSPPGL